MVELGVSSDVAIKKNLNKTVLQERGAHIYSNLACKKSMSLHGWVDGRAGLRIAYSNQKVHRGAGGLPIH